LIDLLNASVPKLSELLKPELLATLQGLAQVIQYHEGQLVHQRGDPKPGLSIVKAGRLVAGNIGMDGSILTTSVLGTGDCFGEFTLFVGLPRTHDIYSHGASEVYQVPRSRFMALFAQEPQLAEALLAIALYRNHSLLEYMDNLRRQPLLYRTAQLLLSNAKRHPETNVIECLQDQLAFTLGVSRVSIGKVLNKLQADELIQLGYRKIIVNDLERLEAWVADRNLLMPLTASGVGSE
tara:strand:- start:142 stop:852 length:711 start_codon:yes stop_codon:yes gene_type:complete